MGRYQITEPLLTIVFEPKTEADQEKMSAVLARLIAGDTSFRIATNSESGQIIIGGMDELHLDNLIGRFKREFKADFDIGAPRVAYRETISREVAYDYTHRKRLNVPIEFAYLKMRLSPTEPSEEYSFESCITDSSFPKEYMQGVEDGIKSAMESGPLEGCPVIGIKVALLDANHDVGSSGLAFEIAARSGMRQGLRMAGAMLLEPVMKVEVISPDECAGDIIGDFKSRRGQVQEQYAHDNKTVIEASVPLANMFGYTNSLLSMSSGRAKYSMLYSCYLPVPSTDYDPSDQPPAAMALRA